MPIGIQINCKAIGLPKNNPDTFESCFKTGNVRIKIAPIIIFEVMHNGCVKTARNLPCRDAGIIQLIDISATIIFVHTHVALIKT